MDEPLEQHRVKVDRRDILRFASHYWWRHKWRGLKSFLLMGISVGADIFYPVYSGKLVDTVSSLDPKADGAVTAVMMAFGALMGIQLIHTWAWGAAFWHWNKFAVRVLHNILTDSMHKVQRFSTDWHVNSFAGATVRKITRGMWSFDKFEDTIFMGFFPAIIIGVGMIIMLIVQLPLVGWFALPMVALFVGASIYLAVKVALPRFQKSAALDTAVGANLADVMTAISTVKSFAGEGREDRHFAETTGEWRKKSLNAWLTNVLIDLGRTHIRLVLMTGMIGLVIWMWMQGTATAGDVTLAITSFFIIGGYLRDIGRHVNELMRSASEIEDAVGFWLREDDIKDVDGARDLVVRGGVRGADIEFDSVSFGYKEGARPIYDGLSVHIRAGEKVALVGASGSGKSTFVKLAQRLYDIQSGAIRIDGQNIGEVTQDSLRRTVALVPQDPVLFHRSLADNIAYGKPDATMDEITRAAAEAYALDFIHTLPLGFDTLVGERGVKLSGGERQRVAIARALLSNAPILILDEATSSLDSVSEHYIQKALERLMDGRTTITIAHRLATIQKADRILVFDRGRIVEQGTHAELLDNPHSIYRRLYEIQALNLVG